MVNPFLGLDSKCATIEVIRSQVKRSYLLCFTFFPGAEGFTTEEDQEMLSRIEKQLKRRFVIGSQVSEHAIVQDFLKQVCADFSDIFS